MNVKQTINAVHLLLAIIPRARIVVPVTWDTQEMDSLVKVLAFFSVMW